MVRGTGNVETGFVAVRTGTGERTLAVTTESEALARVVGVDVARTAVVVAADGTFRFAGD